MGLFIVSWSITKLATDVNGTQSPIHESFVQLFQDMDDTVEACLVAKDVFNESEQADDGWALIGKPSVLPLTYDNLQDLLPFAEREAANTPTRPKPKSVK